MPCEPAYSGKSVLFHEPNFLPATPFPHQGPRTPWLLPPSLAPLQDKGQWAPIRFSCRLNALTDRNSERLRERKDPGRRQKPRDSHRQRGIETPRKGDTEKKRWGEAPGQRLIET